MIPDRPAAFALLHPFCRMRAMLILVLLAAFVAPTAFAQEKIIKSHGFSELGDLKYPEGFEHFDYVNPQAPKGGTVICRAGNVRQPQPVYAAGARRIAGRGAV